MEGLSKSLAGESAHFGLQNGRHSVCLLRKIITFNYHICEQMDKPSKTTCKSRFENVFPQYYMLHYHEIKDISGKQHCVCAVTLP